MPETLISSGNRILARYWYRYLKVKSINQYSKAVATMAYLQIHLISLIAVIKLQMHFFSDQDEFGLHPDTVRILKTRKLLIFSNCTDPFGEEAGDEELPMMDMSEDQLLNDATADIGVNPPPTTAAAPPADITPTPSDRYKASEKWVADSLQAIKLMPGAKTNSSRSSSGSTSYSSAASSAYPHSTVHSPQHIYSKPADPEAQKRGNCA